MKLSPAGLSFLSAFLLASTSFAEEVTDTHVEQLFAESAETATEGELNTLSFVLFDKNSSKISSQYDSILTVVADSIVAKPSMQIELTGHTDNGGSDELNQKLAKDRAESVRAALVAKGVPAERINAFSYGKDRPIADNDSEDGKVLNRQVTIWGIVK